MQKNILLLLHPIDKIYILPHSARICYLGYDFQIKMLITQSFPNFLDIVPSLPLIAHEIKYDYINYLAEIGKTQENKIKWWSSSIASKSNLQTDFFDVICLLVLAQKIIDLKECDYFIVSDIRLYSLLRQNFPLSISNKTYVYSVLYSVTLKLIVYIKIPLARIIFVTKKILYGFKTKNIFNYEKDIRLYIYSWVEERSFDEENKYKDFYLTNLDKFIKRIPKTLFCPYTVKPGLAKRLKNYASIASLDYYTTIALILKAATMFFKVRSLSKFKRLNLDILWNYEIDKENTTLSFLNNYHDYLCWVKFFSLSKGKMVYPFENQPWEKVMLLAFRESLSNMTLIGYQHSAIGNLFLPYLSTDDELTYMPLPDIIVASSEVNLKMLTDTYNKTGIKLYNGGALRYTSVKQKKLLNKIKTIGILLPVNIKMAIEIVSHLLKMNNSHFKYLLKYHPDNKIDTRFQQQNIEIFSGSAHELYNIVDAIIYCSSSSGLEARHYGLPVFRYQGQFIDLEIGENSFNPTIIYAFDEINDSKINSSSLFSQFSPVNAEVWETILN